MWWKSIFESFEVFLENLYKTFKNKLLYLVQVNPSTLVKVLIIFEEWIFERK